MSDGPTIEVIVNGPLPQEAIEALARLLIEAAKKKQQEDDERIPIT